MEYKQAPMGDQGSKYRCFLQQMKPNPHDGGKTYVAGSLEVDGWALGGCGLGSIHKLSGISPGSTFAEQAKLMSEIYKLLYRPGHVLYSLAPRSRNASTLPQLHGLLLQIGAVKIHEFPNICHLPSHIELWFVNIRNAVGVFCNEYGEPYEAPPTEPSTWKYTVDDSIAKLPQRKV